MNTNRHIPTGRQETSIESRNKLEGKKSKYRQMIYDFISESGGSTCDEVEVGLDVRHQTASCFIRFLTQDGLLEATDERRMTRAGRKAIVWKRTLAQSPKSTAANTTKVPTGTPAELFLFSTDPIGRKVAM